MQTHAFATTPHTHTKSECTYTHTHTHREREHALDVCFKYYIITEILGNKITTLLSSLSQFLLQLKIILKALQVSHLHGYTVVKPL